MRYDETALRTHQLLADEGVSLSPREAGGHAESVGFGDPWPAWRAFRSVVEDPANSDPAWLKAWLDEVEGLASSQLAMRQPARRYGFVMDTIG